MAPTTSAAPFASGCFVTEEAQSSAGAVCGGAQLKDFDWSCRMVLSSSSYSTMRKPILLLKLSLDTPDGGNDDKLFELGRDQLDALIKKLAGAQEVLRSGDKSH